MLTITRNPTSPSPRQAALFDNYYEVVEERFAVAAHQRLLERLAAGEDPQDITGISDSFYLDKLIAGNFNKSMSYTVYARIFNLEKEDL